MEYDTENMNVRSRMNDVSHAIQAMPAVSRLSQTHNGHMFSRKPIGFNATLKCYMSKQHGGCGKSQEAPVLLTHSALRVKRWLHRVAEDASGHTFEEWDPIKDADDSQTPVPMIINSSELHDANSNLQEVIPPLLEMAARSGKRTRSAGLRQLEGMGRKRFVLLVDEDNELRSQCE